MALLESRYVLTTGTVTGFAATGAGITGVTLDAGVLPTAEEAGPFGGATAVLLHADISNAPKSAEVLSKERSVVIIRWVPKRMRLCQYTVLPV
jgi:hypothetical protein